MLGPSPVVHDRSGACRGGARSSRPSVAHRDLPRRNCASGCVCLIGIHASVRCAGSSASSLRTGSAHDGRSPLGHCGAVYACRRLRASPSLRLVAPTRLRSASLVGDLLASCLPTAGCVLRPAFQTNAEHPARRLALSPTHRIPVAPQSLRSQRSAIASVLTDLPLPVQRPMLAEAARRHRAAGSGGHPARRGTATLSYRSASYLFPHIGTVHL